MDPRPMYRHAEANPLRRMIRRSAGWKPFSWFYARTLHLIDRAVFRLTRGRATFTSWLADLPVAWLRPQEPRAAWNGRRPCWRSRQARGSWS